MKKLAFALALLATPVFAASQPHNQQDIEGYQKEVQKLVNAYTYGVFRKHTSPQLQKLMLKTKLICDLTFDLNQGEGENLWLGVASGLCLDIDGNAHAQVFVSASMENLANRVESTDNSACVKNVESSTDLSLNLVHHCKFGWKELDIEAEFTPLN